METVEVSKKPVSRLAMYRNKILIGLATVGAAAAPVAAETDINASVAPILEDVIALIPTIISLIIAAVPAIIVLAVVGFIVAFLDQILTMLRINR